VHYLRNDGAASMQVFGQATETIDGIASATGVPQAAGTGAWYVSTTAGKWTRSAVYNPANVSVTGGALTGTNVPYEWAKWGAPIIFGPTGTMANNCVITWGTALPNAYTGGAWVVLPAGAVAAGIPAAAAIQWYVGTDTTHGTCFNSTINLASPGTAGTATAFSTTGPGAFTGVTAQTTIFSSTLAASALGLNGKLKATLIWSLTNNANAKSDNFTIGSTDFFAARTLASNATTRQYLDISVGPVATKQFGTLTELAGAGATGSIAYVYGAEDFSTSLAVAIKGTRGTATDIMVLEAAEIVVAN
jgi:hypothetical protein